MSYRILITGVMLSIFTYLLISYLYVLRSTRWSRLRQTPVLCVRRNQMGVA